MELAMITVAVALPKFREKALLGQGWIPEGGARITTYFAGACVFAFPNEMRRHRAEQTKWFRQDNAGVLVDLDRDEINDPAVLATGNARVVADLARVSERERRILAATIDGYTQAEIAELYGDRSSRAVEGALYRWRKAEQARMANEEEPDV